MLAWSLARDLASPTGTLPHVAPALPGQPASPGFSWAHFTKAALHLSSAPRVLAMKPAAALLIAAAQLVTPFPVVADPALHSPQPATTGKPGTRSALTPPCAVTSLARGSSTPYDASDVCAWARR